MLLRHIRYFLAVAEHRNFTRTAEALHVSQPTLSQQIRPLENMLHAPLLDRSGRMIVLTDAGVAYLDHARRALRDLEAGRRAIHDVQELSRGALRVAMPPTFTAYLVGRLVETFNSRYPGITLTFQEMTQERMEMLLNDDALDVGIAFDEVRSPDIEGQTLLSETFALMVGKSRVREPRAESLGHRKHYKNRLVCQKLSNIQKDLSRSIPTLSKDTTATDWRSPFLSPSFAEE